jgi:hypothetical protein
MQPQWAGSWAPALAVRHRPQIALPCQPPLAARCGLKLAAASSAPPQHCLHACGAAGRCMGELPARHACTRMRMGGGMHPAAATAGTQQEHAHQIARGRGRAPGALALLGRPARQPWQHTQQGPAAGACRPALSCGVQRPCTAAHLHAPAAAVCMPRSLAD